MPFDILTPAHTAISLIAVLLGIGAVARLLGRPLAAWWTSWFIAAAIATSATGFLFPFIGVTPAFAVGIVASLILAVVVVARFATGLRGWWRTAYTLGLVASLYLLVFVTVAQAFAKIPALRALAPTQAEPPFAVAQGVVLLLFIWLGVRALRGRGLRMVA